MSDTPTASLAVRQARLTVALAERINFLGRSCGDVANVREARAILAETETEETEHAR